MPFFFFYVLSVFRWLFCGLLGLCLTFWYKSGFGTKLSPLYGFAKSFKIQNQLSIKPITLHIAKLLLPSVLILA